MANAINSLNYGNNTYTFTLPYGSCSTAARTAAKTVTVDNFSLETGARVAVKFTVTNTAGSPTLNVNSTGAKAIYYKGAAITAGYLAANKVYEFIYNGTQWDLVGDVDTNTTYTFNGAVSTIKDSNLTASRALVSNGSGKVAVSDVTSTELGYLDGVTSAIQTQLDGKAPSSHNHSASDITSGTMSTARLPAASGTSAGITIVYPAASCTTFSSDSGTVTPQAVQKGAKMFAITRPSTSTTNAVTRYSNTTGDVKDSKITIEDVTNTKDSSKKANVLVIPAEGGKKMVYGYCTDQTDGTSFIGGVFDASATSYPYAAGLAIGGTSGNLLWKGKQVATTDMIPTLSSLGAASSSHNHPASNITSGTLSSDRLPTVPISKGGTGATTAAGALENLGIASLLSSGCKVATGSYVGTGQRMTNNSGRSHWDTSEPEYAITLSFDFEPKLLLVSWDYYKVEDVGTGDYDDEDIEITVSFATEERHGVATFINGRDAGTATNSYIHRGYPSGISYDSSANEIEASWSGASVSYGTTYYSNSDTEKGLKNLDINGATYQYVAIG